MPTSLSLAYPQRALTRRGVFQVCDFIQQRDGHRADPDSIFLTNGASEAVRLVLRTAIRGAGDGVMVPVPQVTLSCGNCRVVIVRCVCSSRIVCTGQDGVVVCYHSRAFTTGGAE